jgi:hypothetical protein
MFQLEQSTADTSEPAILRAPVWTATVSSDFKSDARGEDGLLNVPSAGATDFPHPFAEAIKQAAIKPVAVSSPVD